MNAETAWNIGECLRSRSMLNETADPDALARQAMDWYRSGHQLDPLQPRQLDRQRHVPGLDNTGDRSLGRQNRCMTSTRRISWIPTVISPARLIGRHYVLTGDNAAARSWLERSMRLQWQDNDLTAEYLPMPKNGWKPPPKTEARGPLRPPGDSGRGREIIETFQLTGLPRPA